MTTTAGNINIDCREKERGDGRVGGGGRGGGGWGRMKNSINHSRPFRLLPSKITKYDDILYLTKKFQLPTSKKVPQIIPVFLITIVTENRQCEKPHL